MIADQEHKMMDHRQRVYFATLDTFLLDLENVNNVLWEASAQAQEQLSAWFVAVELNQMMMLMRARCVVLESFHQMQGTVNHVHLERFLLHKDNANVTIADQEHKMMERRQHAS